jgi:NADH pyrophosphatase NudC (nudix superfamily)
MRSKAAVATTVWRRAAQNANHLRRHRYCSGGGKRSKEQNDGAGHRAGDRLAEGTSDRAVRITPVTARPGRAGSP